MYLFHNRTAAASDTDHTEDALPHSQITRKTSDIRPSGLEDSTVEGFLPQEAQGCTADISGGEFMVMGSLYSRKSRMASAGSPPAWNSNCSKNS
jgi:hypothetical protein